MVNRPVRSGPGHRRKGRSKPSRSAGSHGKPKLVTCTLYFFRAGNPQNPRIVNEKDRRATGMDPEWGSGLARESNRPAVDAPDDGQSAVQGTK